jgi:hypothetical protein
MALPQCLALLPPAVWHLTWVSTAITGTVLLGWLFDEWMMFTVLLVRTAQVTWWQLAFSWYDITLID